MIDILMPRLSDTMTEGAIAAWHKKPGDTVAPGDLLVEIETDKALMEQEAYEAGTLVEILVPEGENVAIGTPIARLDDGRETPSASATGGDEPSNAESGGAVTVDWAAPGEPVDDAPPALEVHPMMTQAADKPVNPEHADRQAATPLVRRLARERGIELSHVTGSGPGGRIVRADLDELERVPSPTAAFTPSTVIGDAREPHAVPFDGIRQAVASRLTVSGTTVPTFTATVAADVGALLALRTQMNEANAATGTKISVNDLLVRAAAVALRVHPDVNASYSATGRGETLLHGRVHVGIAVASPAGLVVPVVRDADRAAVSAIASASRELIQKAAERTLTTLDMSDGTFTISNLGMYGVEHFTAIINPPQGAILAVGAAKAELALVDGTVEPRMRLRLTLTADHRIIDGALGAQFLSTLIELLEHPLRIIA